MAPFGKKKKNNAPQEQFQDDDDFDIFSVVDEESSLSGYSYPKQSYEDFEGEDIDEDMLGISNRKGNAQPVKKGSKVKNILGLGAILAIAAVFIGSQFMGGDNNNNAQPEETTKVDTRIEGSKEGIVVNEQLGKTYTGNDNGSPKNGTGAIMAFDHAYYNKRNGEEVMKNFHPSVNSYDASFVQSHIDRIPGGTTYNLEITPRQTGVSYDVILTLNIPGGKSAKWKQNFETEQVDGRYYVKSFTSKRSE